MRRAQEIHRSLIAFLALILSSKKLYLYESGTEKHLRRFETRSETRRNLALTEAMSVMRRAIVLLHS